MPSQPRKIDKAIAASLKVLCAPVEKPTMPLEDCPTCSLIPECCRYQHVSSLVSDYDVDYGGEGHHNDVPQQVSRLEKFIEGAVNARVTDGRRSDAILRCPTCNRLYLFTESVEDDGARIYTRKTYERLHT
jgi:hypothetical protein